MSGKTLPESKTLSAGARQAPASRSVVTLSRHLNLPYKDDTEPERPAPALLPEEEEASFLESETFGLERARELGKQDRTFCVVIPTWNRAATLPRAFTSLLAQRYPRWMALVLDDGSTDGTQAIVHEWQARDPRFHYVPYAKNRGGVAMNERGMTLAIELASWWARLGSDDWWGAAKLDHDAIALGSCPFEACYGSYRIQKGNELYGSFNKSHASSETKNLLLAGKFGVSWANVACTTDVLRRVKERYGRFAHPDLWNMEDFLVNARIAKMTDWVWRGVVGGKLLVNPRDEGLTSEELEAVWNETHTGASGNEQQRNRDYARTLELIAND
jgi:Glycosyl transferase family 2